MTANRKQRLRGNQKPSYSDIEKVRWKDEVVIGLAAACTNFIHLPFSDYHWLEIWYKIDSMTRELYHGVDVDRNTRLVSGYVDRDIIRGLEWGRIHQESVKAVADPLVIALLELVLLERVLLARS